MREHEQKDVQHTNGQQQNQPPVPHSGPSSHGQGGNSPYSKRDYSVYVRKGQPQPPGFYSHANIPSSQPGSGYRQDVQGYAQPPQNISGQNQWQFNQYHTAPPPTKPRKKRNRGLVVLAVAVLGFAVLAGISLLSYNVINAPPAVVEEAPDIYYDDAATEQEPRPPRPTTPSGEVNLRIESRPPTVVQPPVPGQPMTIPQVAQAVRPSVVGIINNRANRIFSPESEGSGIIITEDGYIVTNAHVVERADSLVVVFEDKSEYEAYLVGYDSRTDIAVLRVDRTGLPAAILGDSNQLEVGETVVAIGNPGGVELAGSVTRGVVSALNRVVTTPYETTVFIQTDAAINPGNSGGPLSNEFGQVIGINTAKIIELGYEGIGFAIPISYAVPIIEELILHGRVTGRVLLGITGENVASEGDSPAGVRIVSISSESLLENGVEPGDIITYMDERRIRNLNDIRVTLERNRAGDSVEITLYRPGSGRVSGETFEVTAYLIEDLG